MENKIRDLAGYEQYNFWGTWKFIVTSFDSTTCGEAGFCTVMKSDGTTERVQIDAKDRILINGKWYGRAHWHH